MSNLSFSEGGSAGQNLYIKFNYTPFVSRDWESAISAPQSSWYSEVDYVGPQDVQRFTYMHLVMPFFLKMSNLIYTQICQRCWRQCDWALHSTCMGEHSSSRMRNQLLSCMTWDINSTSLTLIILVTTIQERNGFYAQFIVCNYSPAGNFIGLPIYRIGITGTACPSGTQNNNDLCALITAWLTELVMQWSTENNAWAYRFYICILNREMN